jgi:spermidine synthase
MNRFSIFFALILLGITAIITQVVLIREFIVIFSGNELSIGIILANWLILEAAGSYFAGHKAAKIKHSFLPYAMLQWLLAIILPLVIYLTRTILPILNIVPGESIDIFTIFYISFLLLIPLGLINGAQFSFGCCLLTHLKKKGASLVGNVYALEAIGSVFGGLIATYICLQYLNTFQTAFFLSFLNSISALLLLYFISDRTNNAHHKKLLFTKTGHWSILIILFLISVTGILDNLHQDSIKKQWPGYRIVSYNNSVYGNVTFLERSDQWHLVSNGLTIATLPTPDIAQIEDMVHFPLLSHPDPKNVFLLGGGISGIVDELLKYPLISIDYAELDPLLINTAVIHAPDSTLSALRANQIKTHFIDGRYFLRMTQKKFDVILLNIPDPSTLVLNRFYTSEFFEICRTHLRKNGIVIFQIPGSSSYMNLELVKLAKSLLISAENSFRYQRIIPFERTLVLLSNEKFIEEIRPDILSRRLQQRRITSRLFSDHYLKYKLDSTRVRWFNEECNKIASARSNSDLMPSALYYDLLYWNSSLSPRMASMYSWFENLTVIHWIVFTLIIFSTFYFFRFKTYIHSKSTLIISIFSTGFIGMGITIIFILAFQSFYGYVFHWVGLIISAFMVGLSVGGLWGAKYVNQSKDSYSLFYRLEGSIVIYLLFIIICLLSIQDLIKIDILYSLFPYIVLCLILICGIFVGAQFPFANKLYQDNSDLFTQTAGVIYASDLLGAWAGGIIITLILIPILGTIETAFVLFIVKLQSTITFRLKRL